MALIAQAELEIDANVDTLFGKLVDFRTWSEWMPDAFRPVRGPARALVAGDRIVVRMGGGLVAPLRVLRVRASSELSWRGGVPGLLVGEHSFFFEPIGPTRTRVRSAEPFTGLLALIGPMRSVIERDASAVGRQMLEGLRGAVA
ncbi:MAG: SRPBCC family protein [Polyangiales bacterium]